RSLTDVLDRSLSGHGGVVGVVGAAGIGKSRVVREAVGIQAARGVNVFWTFCESVASEVPRYVVSHLMRAAIGIAEMDAASARAWGRPRFAPADPQDLPLLDALLGIAAPDIVAPQIAPDARRRRLTALVNGATLARTTPAVFVIEDVQWIDEVSESMLAD